MNNNINKTPSEADAELQREIRSGRKFTLSEAIGRMAGPGAMKGVSPVSGQQQAVNEIEQFLKERLSDTNGSLRAVLLRRIGATEHLAGHYDRPLQFLAEAIRHVLDNDHRLKEFVDSVDIEWGQIMGERPYFEKEGCTPHPDDPYTMASVRRTLSHLLEILNANQTA